MARCRTCGAELQDASQSFCGGDRCLRVFTEHREQGPLWSSARLTTGRGASARTNIPPERLNMNNGAPMLPMVLDVYEGGRT